MKGFEITEWDVVEAVKKALGKDITPDVGHHAIKLFDAKAANEAAAFSSDADPGTDENDNDVNAATDRMTSQMAEQIKADPTRFSIFA